MKTRIVPNESDREIHDAKIRAVKIRGLVAEIKELASFLPAWNETKVIEHAHAVELWSTDGFNTIKGNSK